MHGQLKFPISIYMQGFNKLKFFGSANQNHVINYAQHVAFASMSLFRCKNRFVSLTLGHI